MLGFFRCPKLPEHSPDDIFVFSDPFGWCFRGDLGCHMITLSSGESFPDDWLSPRMNSEFHVLFYHSEEWNDFLINNS